MKDLMVRPLCSALEISKRENGESEAGLGVRAEEADRSNTRKNNYKHYQCQIKIYQIIKKKLSSRKWLFSTLISFLHCLI